VKNGICLLCFGNESFGQLTYNLVASIKQHSNIPITIFTDFISLKSVDTKLFDDLRDIPHNSFFINGMSHPNRFKMCLYDNSPYQNTMYLDVDSLYMSDKPIDYLFKLLNDDVDIIGQNEKTINLKDTTKIFHGYDVSTFKPAFNFTKPKLNQMHGQFLLFKKNKNTHTFFNISKEIYDKMNDKTIVNIHEWSWFGRPIEELSMTIATGLIDIKILENFAPVSVQKENLNYDEILKKKYFISICGSSTEEIALKIGGYCQDELYTKKYIDHYNKKILELTNYNCKKYTEKIYCV
jgi:hypothetical protein